MKILFLILSLMLSFGVMGQDTPPAEPVVAAGGTGETTLTPNGSQLCDCDANPNGDGCTAADGTVRDGDNDGTVPAGATR